MSRHDVSTLGDATPHEAIDRALDGVGDGAVRSIDAAMARERTRQALFGEGATQHKIDRFTLIERVGAGAMGTVYAAFDPRLDRRVAVKVMRTPAQGPAPSDVDRRRMLAEARAMARVTHPNVITVYEVGIDDSGARPVLWVAMEFVEGRTLRRWLAQERPEWSRIVAAYVAAGRGLVAVHRAGLVHRDFKPDNVMIDADGRVRVMDFGLARDTGRLDRTAPIPTDPAITAEPITRTGAIVGTPAYMAPEQFEGGPADAKCDQYAFSIALWESLWGERPFSAATSAELIAKVTGDDPTPDPPRSTVPGRVRAAVRRGISRSPEDRFPSMEALLAALEPRSSRRRVVAWLGAGSLALGGAWLAMPSHAVEPCSGADVAFGDAWSPARAQQLTAAFSAAGPVFAEAAARDVGERFDAYRSAWLSEHRAACEATHVLKSQSEARLDLRMRCLDRRKRELEALIEVMAAADQDAVEHASDAAAGLTSPAHCGDAAFLDALAEPPGEPMLATRVEALHAEVARAVALTEMARGAEALAILEPLALELPEVPYPPLHAEVEVATGRAMLQRDDLDAALGMLERGYFTARAAKVPVDAARAALELASMQATLEPAQAEIWIRLADTEIDTHDLDALESSRLAAHIVVAERSGDYAEALAVGQRWLELEQADCGADCDGLGEVHGMLALVHGHLGAHHEQVAHAREALAQEERRHGPDHPHVADALMRLTDALSVSGRQVEALPYGERALQIRERVLPPGHVNLVQLRALLGGTMVEAGRAKEGLEMMDTAVALARELDNPNLLAPVLSASGFARETLKQWAEAAVAYREAVDLMRALHPEGHPQLAIVLSNVGNMEHAQGRLDESLVWMQDALTMRRATVQGPDPQLVLFLYNVARILADLGRRDEAIAHFQEAVELTADGPIDRNAIRVRKKLAEMLRESDPEAARGLLEDATARCAALGEDAKKTAGCDDATGSASP